MNERQLGELIGKVNAIKENTDKIPSMAISVALHEGRLNVMEPKVNSHEATAQRAMGLSAAIGIIVGFLSNMLPKWGG